MGYRSAMLEARIGWGRDKIFFTPAPEVRFCKKNYDALKKFQNFVGSK
jgi:hypothetical protein